jgi:hypothetical protein
MHRIQRQASRDLLFLICFLGFQHSCFSHSPSSSSVSAPKNHAECVVLGSRRRAAYYSDSFNRLTLTECMRLRGGGANGNNDSGKKARRNNPTEWRLFVANLPQGLNDDGLREAFEPFGDVEEARVSFMCFNLDLSVDYRCHSFCFLAHACAGLEGYRNWHVSKDGIRLLQNTGSDGRGFGRNA